METRPRCFSRFAVAALCLIVLGGCASLTEPWAAPEVALTGIRPRALGLDRQSFIVSLRVRNPNDRTLPVKAMTYRLRVEDSQIAEGASELARQIPAFGEETVDVEVNTSLLGLMPGLPALAMARDNLDWEVSGTVTLAGGLVTLPYRYSGEIDPMSLMAAMR